MLSIGVKKNADIDMKARRIIVRFQFKLSEELHLSDCNELVHSSKKYLSVV